MYGIDVVLGNEREAQLSDAVIYKVSKFFIYDNASADAIEYNIITITQ